MTEPEDRVVLMLGPYSEYDDNSQTSLQDLWRVKYAADRLGILFSVEHEDDTLLVIVHDEQDRQLLRSELPAMRWLG